MVFPSSKVEGIINFMCEKANGTHPKGIHFIVVDSFCASLCTVKFKTMSVDAKPHFSFSAFLLWCYPVLSRDNNGLFILMSDCLLSGNSHAGFQGGK